MRCLMVGHWRVGVLAVVVLLAGVVATPAEALKREDPLAGLTSSQRRVFQNYTRLYCKQFFRFDDDRYVLLPNYERARENSTGKTEGEVEADLTVVKRERRRTSLGYQMVEVKYPPPSAEVIISARVIPAIDVGHYGFVNSVRIKEIVGPTEMIVSRIELIPPGQVGTSNNELRIAAMERQKTYEYTTYRLLGFSTKDLEAGKTYYGPRKKGLQIAVMSTDPQHKFVLVNYDRLERVRTSEFANVLAYVQIEPLAFIDMVRENREKLSTKGDQASLISIYRRFYNRYRPKRLSSTSRPDITKPMPELRPDPEPEPEPQVDDGPAVNEPAPEPEPEAQPEPKPRPEPRPRPEPEEEEEEDDWDHEEDTKSSPDEPTFFGIPL